MGKAGTRLPSFCLNRIRPPVRVVRSPPIQSKQQANLNINSSSTTTTTKFDQQKTIENPGTTTATTIGAQDKCSPEVVKTLTGRKIMIVVDSSIEAKGALLWALSHTVQSNDHLILLQVTKPSKQGKIHMLEAAATSEEPSKDRAPARAYELVNSLKNMSQLRRPEIQIEVAVAEGKEKGPLIVEEAKKQGVALLVLGQKKRSMTWRLIMMWASNRVTASGVVEYCIQNADCMAIAVRRKSKKHGGYLITTKRHKDFWLLA